MGLIGTLTHASFDAILISIILAGVRRSTGITLKTGFVGNKNYQSVLGFIVGLGERMFDISVALMAAYPSIFERQQPPPPPPPPTSH